MYDLKQANKKLSCFNCSLYPVVDAHTTRLSRATRGSVLHWYAGALHPASPASGSQERTWEVYAPTPRVTTISVGHGGWKSSSGNRISPLCLLLSPIDFTLRNVLNQCKQINE